MPALRRAAVLLCAAALLATGCTTAPAGPAPAAVGIQGADKWPGRGDLVRDDALRTKAGSVLATWSPPGQGKADKPRLLWAGRADGTVLAVAVVVATGPDRIGRSWQVELSGSDVDQLSVTASSVYPDNPGIENIRAVRSPCCERRYLLSTKVTGLAVTGGSALAVKDSLSDRAPFAKCSPRGVRITDDAGSFGYVDLGPTLAFGQAPPKDVGLLNALQGLNTCSGPLPAGANGVYDQATHSLTIPAAGPGRLIELNWATPKQHNVVTVVWRPDTGGAPTFSASFVDLSERLGVFPLDLPSGRVIALTWPTADGNRLVLPPGATPLVDSPGLTVLSPPPAPFDVKLMSGTQLVATTTVS